MANVDRRLARADRRAERLLQRLGDEFRDKRLTAGLSQESTAAAARVSRSQYSRIENGRVVSVSLLQLARIAGVLGLDLVTQVFPGESPLRDIAQQSRIAVLAKAIKAPLTLRLEVPLPADVGRIEQRAWDAEIRGRGLKTRVEIEMRLRDGQATERRLALKRRDDPADGLVVVIADTEYNRRVLREQPELFNDLPRLRRAGLLGTLRAGLHPPSGLVLL